MREVPELYSKRTRTFLALSLPLLLISSVVTYAVSFLDQRNRLQETRTNTELHAQQQVAIINLIFGNIVSDLRHMVEQSELLEFLDNSRLESQTELAREYLSDARFRGIYDQIRYLDEKGKEVIRVNFNAGEPSIVPDHRLQNKGSRYYFKDAFRLSRGEVFISRFDLNMEQGRIELPIKPMIRFAMPVFDSDGLKRGVLLLNYLGEQLTSLFKFATRNMPGQTALLNSNGYWLAGPIPEDEWGFMYPDRKDRTFSATHPNTWERILARDSGQFRTEQGLYTLATVYPLEAGYRASGMSMQGAPPFRKTRGTGTTSGRWFPSCPRAARFSTHPY